MSNGNRGQINLIATILSALGLLGGGVYFLSGAFGKVNDINAIQTKDIAVIQEQIKPLTEMRDKLNDMDKNILLMMQKQGVKPFERISNLATSTPYNGQ